jgi:hypothetical protein
LAIAPGASLPGHSFSVCLVKLKTKAEQRIPCDEDVSIERIFCGKMACSPAYWYL